MVRNREREVIMEFKEVDCPQCGGTGVHERACRVCGGRSSENCGHCHGKGREDVGCPRSDGQGKKIIYSH